MKYSIIERHGSKVMYVTTGSCHWLNLLNDLSLNKEYAYKYNTKKEAIEAMNKFIADAGSMYNGLLDVKGIRD